MKLIIPMAGMGKRMRPHTLTTPKPLIPIAGKTIVQRLVEEIVASCTERVDEIAFIVGNFGRETEENLKKVASDAGAAGSILYQEKALGIAHAVLCAKEVLQGKVMVAFADSVDGTIWVKKVEDPSRFGVVKLNEEKIITDFVEKPGQFISDLAIIGIYYFREGNLLRVALQNLIDNNIKEKGEYQFTSALQIMKQNGLKFNAATVKEWFYCGNKNSTIYTNRKILEYDKGKNLKK